MDGDLEHNLSKLSLGDHSWRCFNLRLIDLTVIFGHLFITVDSGLMNYDDR